MGILWVPQQLPTTVLHHWANNREGESQCEKQKQGENTKSRLCLTCTFRFLTSPRTFFALLTRWSSSYFSSWDNSCIRTLQPTVCLHLNEKREDLAISIFMHFEASDILKTCRSCIEFIQRSETKFTHWPLKSKVKCQGEDQAQFVRAGTCPWWSGWLKKCC